MTEARIGRRPVTSPATESGLIRPEVSHQFPRVRLVPEQPQPKPETGLKDHTKAQEAVRSVAGVRSDLSQESSLAAAVPLGIFGIEHVTKDEQNRPRSMKPSGLLTPVRWDTYTDDKPDGTQEVYLQRHPERPLQMIGKIYPQEEGVWKEVWSEPRGRKGKRVRLGNPERVGEVARDATTELPDGTKNTRLEIYSKEYIEKQIAIAQERAKRISEALSTIKHIPSEHDQLIEQVHKKQLRSILHTTKETPAEQLVQTMKLVAVNGTSSVLLWAPKLVLGPVGVAAHVPLAMGISFLGNTLLNKNFNTDQTQVQSQITMGAIFTGVGIGSLFGTPLVGLLGGVAGFLGATGFSLIERQRAWRKFTNEHPEIIDKSELKRMYSVEKYETDARKNQEKGAQKIDMALKARVDRMKRFGIIPQYTEEFFQENKIMAESIRAKIPDITLPELGMAIDNLRLQHSETDAAGYYIGKATKGMLKRSLSPLAFSIGLYGLGPHLPGVGEVLKLIFAKAPLVVSGIFTTWGSVVNPILKYKQVKAVREEMKQNHPDLLRELGNGK